MGREEEERLLFPSFSFPGESFAEAATSGSGGEQKKARQRRRRKARPPAEGEGGDEQFKKRRLSDEQARFLELSFRKERKLETPRKVQLAAELGLDAKQVAVWFQNRRARHKSKLMEEEFSKLRAAHDAVVLQNCHLETELLKLKDKLADAEEKNRKLMAAAAAATGGAAGSSSPSSSSFSTVTYHPAAMVGQFGVEEEAAEYAYNSYMNMSEYAYNSYMNMMDLAPSYFGGVYDHFN
ncbi:homeobox-leucine zipper protein HOX12-like isoform X2 [Phragmites australis]|uniref:homeobox-leucine zipper protein HOX12-like isoform X2 n=1 Tax=Phragmites australis TaxID=29695 RepID=UPI002D7A2485|nr:homeobox-leucine zipper protein HOX12-like isoform X2 [Phragmites australis]